MSSPSAVYLLGPTPKPTRSTNEVSQKWNFPDLTTTITRRHHSLSRTNKMILCLDWTMSARNHRRPPPALPFPRLVSKYHNRFPALHILPATPCPPYPTLEPAPFLPEQDLKPTASRAIATNRRSCVVFTIKNNNKYNFKPLSPPWRECSPRYSLAYRHLRLSHRQHPPTPRP